jgi:hypothetical protein
MRIVAAVEVAAADYNLEYRSINEMYSPCSHTGLS